MEHEYTVSGRILTDNAMEFVCVKPIFNFKNFEVKIRVVQSLEDSSKAPTVLITFPNIEDRKNVSTNEISELCKELSKAYACKVFMYKDHEVYGNANVYNGGSDYEVVNEECFLSVCENGVEIFSKTTDCWNDISAEIEKL